MEIKSLYCLICMCIDGIPSVPLLAKVSRLVPLWNLKFMTSDFFDEVENFGCMVAQVGRLAPKGGKSESTGATLRADFTYNDMTNR